MTSKDKINLLVHFMLTGHFYDSEHTNTRCIFHFDDQKIYYDDAINLGKLNWLTDDQLNIMLSKVGPSIIGLTQEVFMERIKKKKSMIASALHDQAVFAGIGNYLRAEALYKAKIAPNRKVQDISDTELKKLYKSITKIIKVILDLNGVEDYKNFDGKPGKYKFKIYGRGNNTVKISGQTVYWDSKVQI